MREAVSMKKLVSVIVVLIFLLSLAGCKEQQPNGRDTAYTYIVMEVTENYLIVAETDQDGNAVEALQYQVSNWFHPSTKIEVGYVITIKHNNIVAESDPMQFGKIYSMEYWDRETGLSTVVIAD